MKLIVGLGNPGNQYNFTRHNFGFLALDFYAKIHHLSWENHPKFDSLHLKSGDTIFIKPQTFYNLSGTSVQKFLKFYKLPSSSLLVVCDDFDLDFGTIRFRTHGSAGGNNGLKSIISSLNSSDFARLRLGTNHSELRNRLGDTDFVLSRFTAEEKSALPALLTTTAAKITDFINQSPSAAD